MSRPNASAFVRPGPAELFLGWTRGGQANRYYYWRQPRDMKGSGGRGHFTLRHNVLRQHLRLDPARARSGDPVASAEYLGTEDTLDNAIADFSTRYADQNQRDYNTFVKAIADGRIQTVTGI